jgi:hypothetical protein
MMPRQIIDLGREYTGSQLYNTLESVAKDLGWPINYSICTKTQGNGNGNGRHYLEVSLIAPSPILPILPSEVSCEICLNVDYLALPVIGNKRVIEVLQGYFLNGNGNSHAGEG